MMQLYLHPLMVSQTFPEIADAGDRFEVLDKHIGRWSKRRSGVAESIDRFFEFEVRAWAMLPFRKGPRFCTSSLIEGPLKLLTPKNFVMWLVLEFWPCTYDCWQNILSCSNHHGWASQSTTPQKREMQETANININRVAVIGTISKTNSSAQGIHSVGG